MQFTTAALTAILSATALAAPAPIPAGAKSMTAAVSQWSIERFVRNCDNVNCHYQFTVDTHEDGVAPAVCDYGVQGVNGKPPTQSAVGPVTCGPYIVTSQWSNYFGDDKGFTTLSVVDYTRKLIVWPAYTDAQLQNGYVVSPDLAFQPQVLP